MFRFAFKIFTITAICLFGCKKDSSDEIPSVPFAFQAFFSNGDTHLIKEGFEGTNSFGRAGAVIDTAGHYFEIQSTNFTGGGNKVSIYFMKTFSEQPDTAGIHSIFHTGSEPYGCSEPDSLKDGVEIILVDTAGRKWSTAYGNQNSASFTVTEHKKNDFDLFTPFMTSGEFDCVFYDSLGNALQNMSGSFTGRSVVYP